MSTLKGLVTVRQDTYTNGARCYVATSEDAPDCVGYGDTPDEAIASLRDAIHAVEVVDSTTATAADESAARGDVVFDVTSSDAGWLTDTGVAVPS